jgi:hypothetical protein
MVQYRVKRSGADFEQVAKDLELDIEELKRETMLDMAQSIAMNSPVDSGTYAVNHEVGLRSGSFQATKTRPDDRSRLSRDGKAHIPNAREIGLRNMQNDIGALDLSKDTFVFRNPMAYAGLIEAGVTGDKTGNPPVYAATVREAPAIIARVAAVIAARNR